MNVFGEGMIDAEDAETFAQLDLFFLELGHFGFHRLDGRDGLFGLELGREWSFRLELVDQLGHVPLELFRLLQ